MSGKIWSAMLVLVFALSHASQAGSQQAGKPIPAITESFASGEVSPGQTWKVYLKVSDPQGEIANIYATVEQPGVGTYPLSIIKVKEGNRKELSGYIYLSTSNPVASLDSVNLTLTVQVQDSSGNLSRPAVFPLSINNRFNQKAAPPGIFQEKEIGPIMVTLRTILPNKGRVAEKPNSGGHCEERKRRGNLIFFDFIMNRIASLRSQ